MPKTPNAGWCDSLACEAWAEKETGIVTTHGEWKEGEPEPVGMPHYVRLTIAQDTPPLMGPDLVGSLERHLEGLGLSVSSCDRESSQ
jgi:hypothetical protein